ncbi:MAG: mechanosensitive ion channel family protein [Alphaproteobacteria bacterium]|nr:mechanosensitive ion channel family protein [Alphaproteobacteria bacterium]
MKRVSRPAPLLLTLLALAGILLCLDAVWAQEPPRWTGEWQAISRNQASLITLTQEGDRVTGTVQPGDGRITARVDGRQISGTWTVGDQSGALVFALSADGQSLTGRYDAGEYLNARRVENVAASGRRISAEFSPRETLRTVITGMNDAFVGGRPSAIRFFAPLLQFEAEETRDVSENASRTRRLTALWRILNLSTFRIFQAPGAPPGDTASFGIGPVNSNVSYELRFQRDENGRWDILLESMVELEDIVQGMLEDLGHTSYAEFEEATNNSPRGAMRQFMHGVDTWFQGGREEALATLDLSYLAPALAAVEGPILADYLVQIIDRAGLFVMQEIPNDPGRSAAYIHYVHPLGSIVLEKTLGEDGELDQWRFSPSTLRSAPALYNAIQDLPLAPGVTPVEPFTNFFKTRERVRLAAPVLLERDLVLENWQWIALAVAFIVAVLAGLILTSVILPLASRLTGLNTTSGYTWPARVVIFGAVLLIAIAELGVGQGGLGVVGQTIGVITIVGLTLLLYKITHGVGRLFLSRAQETRTYVDEIVASLATGIIKLVIVILGVITCADIVGLPYEGVIAGLGVGGVALAFASRDTISNMLGGMLLMADRPFKRGDLVETDGQWAMVQDVGLRSTRMRTFDDAQLIIPNAQLSDRAIVNWGKRQRRKVAFDISLTYDTPREKLDRFVERLKEIYVDQPRSDAKESYIGLKTFAASSIDIEFWGYFNVYGYEAHVRARHAFIGDVIDLANEVGVSFAFPTRTVHMMMEEPADPKDALT